MSRLLTPEDYGKCKPIIDAYHCMYCGNQLNSVGEICRNCSQSPCARCGHPIGQHPPSGCSPCVSCHTTFGQNHAANCSQGKIYQKYLASNGNAPPLENLGWFPGVNNGRANPVVLGHQTDVLVQSQVLTNVELGEFANINIKPIAVAGDHKYPSSLQIIFGQGKSGWVIHFNPNNNTIKGIDTKLNGQYSNQFEPPQSFPWKPGTQNNFKVAYTTNPQTGEKTATLTINGQTVNTTLTTKRDHLDIQVGACNVHTTIDG